MSELLHIVSEIDPKEITIAYLERAREEWLPHYHRANRAGGNNGEANRDASDALKPIDRLLDELGEIMLKHIDYLAPDIDTEQSAA